LTFKIKSLAMKSEYDPHRVGVVDPVVFNCQIESEIFSCPYDPHVSGRDRRVSPGRFYLFFHGLDIIFRVDNDDHRGTLRV
jgi:hypothetical protein